MNPGLALTDTLEATTGGDTLRKSIQTNLGSCRLLSSRDVVELLDAVEEELAVEVELGSPEAAILNVIRLSNRVVVEVEFTGPAPGPSIYSIYSIVSLFALNRFA